MKRLSTRCGALLVGLLFGLPVGSAWAQNQIRGRVMVVVDTSGSMIWPFDKDNASQGGDGDAQSLFTDTTQAMKNYYPGKLLNGQPQGSLSRMYAAKKALFDVVNSAGQVDFGLMRYAPADFCADKVNCCPFAGGACICNSDYINNASAKCNPATDGLLSFYGGCGPVANGIASDGAQILVQPTQVNANSEVLKWVDNVEDFRAGGPGGLPLNGELRAGGDTPVAGSVRTAMEKWYKPIFNASKGGNCNPMQDPLCDPQINCRPYVFVFMTDGADTCEAVGAPRANNPPLIVDQLTKINPQNPVKSYIVGMAFFQGNPAIAVLDKMAANGGTTKAILANNQAEIKGAFADIAQSSVKFELCNAKDDDCNMQIDEGYDKGAACSIGIGGCERKGIKKCELNGEGTRCCVDDGKPDGACAPLAAGTPAAKEVCGNNVDDECNGVIDDPMVCMGGQVCVPTPEVCDGLDSDCTGKADDNLVDEGKGCGLALGVCKQGLTVCQAGKLVCVGATMPQAETCNGLDDDCDGIVDGMTRSCYSGPMNTDGNGNCRSGQQQCLGGKFATCIGESLPKSEVCNGIDDDCNAKVDDVPGAGKVCCPSAKCGIGACKEGTMECLAGSLQCINGRDPISEICDQQDNDCNGMVDDLAGLGTACTPMGGCPGKLACDFMKQQIICQPTGQVGKETCNGLDDDCDGLIDELDPDLPMQDPRVNQACGNDKGLPLPCIAGKTICRGAMIVCDGAVGPQKEVCDGLDQDCDGKLDNAAPCPMNFACYEGNCDPFCLPNEFPCPGGFSPIDQAGQCVCVPDKNCMPECKAPLECDTSNGKCVDRCLGKMCPPGQKCDPASGSCTGCEKFGCPDACTRCNRATHVCDPDKCCNVQCNLPAGEFCDPSNGQCVKVCVPVCPMGQVCESGACVADKCSGVACPQGQACNGSNGMCEPNGCFNKTCGMNLACCQNECRVDPCAAVKCPGFAACRVNQLDCLTTCIALPQPPKEEVVAAGGAFACSLAPVANRASGRVFYLSFLGLVCFLTARRRRGARAEVR